MPEEKRAIPFFKESVNAALGTAAGDYLPDEMFDWPIYSSAVIAELDKIIPGIKSIPADDERRPAADRAIIYTTAIKLFPFYQQQIMKSEQTPAAKTERFEIDWNALLTGLQAALDDALGELDPEYLESVSSPEPGFRLTFGDGGCRPCHGFWRV